MVGIDHIKEIVDGSLANIRKDPKLQVSSHSTLNIGPSFCDLPNEIASQPNG